MSTDIDPLAVFIESQAGMAEALLGQHNDDGTGHCRVCTCGGQAGRQVWPCTTFVAAKAAAAGRRHRVAPDEPDDPSERDVVVVRRTMTSRPRSGAGRCSAPT